MSKSNKLAFEDWFSAYNQELRQYLVRKVGEQDAPDVLQETWLHLLKLPDSYVIQTPRAFLYRIARNLAVDFGRKQNRAAINLGEDGDFDDFPAPQASPELQLEQHWHYERFLSAIQELPDTRKQAFLLNRMQGMTHAEIAKLLGLSEKSVQRHIMQALNFLAKRLAD